MSAAGAAEEESCDSIKRFVSGINIQTSSLDDFIRISNIFASFNIDKCDSLFTSVTNDIFRTFYDLLKKFQSEQNVQMQAVQLYKIQEIRAYLGRFAEMFHFLKKADESGENNSKIKAEFLRRFSESQLAKNVYNLVEWKKRQKPLTNDDLAMLAITGAQGGRSKRKKNYRSGSRGRNGNSHRRMNRMSYKKNKNKSRRALHRKKKQ